MTAELPEAAVDTVDEIGGLDGAAWEALAARFGTPFYLYDADAIAARAGAVRRAFDGLVKVYFAVKTNPDLALLKALRAHVDGLDISSGGELDQALRAGHAPSAMSFAGPAKTDAELGAAIRHGVGAISVESSEEIVACGSLAAALGARAQVALRINPQLLNRSFGLKMGGRAIQFGIDEESLPQAVAALAACAPHVEFRGVHVYAGSQCFQAEGIAQGVTNTLRLAEEVERTIGTPCSTINLGGGFGVAHGEEGPSLDLDALARALVPVLRTFHARTQGRCELAFELGRYLAADAGVYVARVIRTKDSRGKRFCMVDGGLNHQLAAAGTFGAALRGNFPLRNLTRPEAPRVRCDVAGPSCNPTDLLGIDVELPEPRRGDLVAVLKSGSYGLTASPILFLGRRTPAELVRHEGRITLGRSAHDIADFN